MIDFILVHAPVLWSWIVLALGAAKLIRPNLPYRMRTLVWATLGFMILYAGILTCGQYLTWKADSFGAAFLSAPLSGLGVPLIEMFPNVFNTALGYFVYYVWSRFWLPMLVSVLVAFLFGWFLRGLGRYRERFFASGETEFGLLAALAVGWPGFVLFVPAAFVFVVLVSIIRGIFFREAYTTLGLPLAAGAASALAFAPAVFSALGLTLGV